MKFFIVGLHGSGKREVADILESQGVTVGKLFSNIEKPSADIYGSMNYKQFDKATIHEIFENNAYVFLRELKHGTERYYEGLATYTVDTHEVFVLSPDQLVSIPANALPKDTVFIWMDSNRNNRLSRYRDEKCTYNFNEQEKQETQDLNSFIKLVVSNGKDKLLYFFNEEPIRVAAIIFALTQHPDLVSAFGQAFNN